MNKHIRNVIRKVLNAVSNAPHFFDLNDAEKLNAMNAQAYILGKLSAARSANKRNRRDEERP